MALINCPECGKEISSSSEKCIHCGYPLKKETKSTKGINKKLLIICAIIAVLIIAVVLIANIAKGNKKSNATCKVDGCNNKVYTNGYCMSHYGDDRAGKSAELANGSGFEEDDVENIVALTKNSKVTSDSCEFTLTGYNISQKIEPSNCKSSYYHYYEASSGNVYVDVKLSVKNLSSTAVRQDSLFTKAKVYYDGDYEYNCSFVTVDNEGDFEGYTSLYSINPLETMEYHLLAELPKEVKDSGKSLKIHIIVDGTTYECILK